MKRCPPRALVLCLCFHPALACASADATDTLVIRLSYALQYDNNVFRLPAGETQQFGVARDRKADTIERTGLALRVDKKLGRQRIVAELLVEKFAYRANSQLDHAAGNARASWLWAIGSLWDGEVSHTRQRHLASFADIRENLKNLVDQEQVALSARFRFLPRWNVTGSLEDSSVANSEQLRRIFDVHSVSGTLGLNYVNPADDTAGIRWRLTRGDYPNRPPVAVGALPGEYEESEASGALNLRLSGHSRIDGRIGYTERRHNQFASHDYHGVTGRGRHLWQPSGKLSVATSAWREIRNWEDLTASYVLTTGIGLLPTWAVTSKVQLHANLNYEKRDFLGTPGFLPGEFPRREDRVGFAQFGALYAPDRNLELSLVLEHGRRWSTFGLQEYAFRSILASLRASF